MIVQKKDKEEDEESDLEKLQKMMGSETEAEKSTSE